MREELVILSYSILKNDYLQTPKNVNVDPTVNDLVVYGERKKP